MNIAIFAFGRAGCQIADQFKRFEKRTRVNVSEFIVAADTSSPQLNGLSYIDEDWRIVYGQQKFEERGARGDLKPAVEMSKHLGSNIRNAVQTISRRDLDAFLVLGSLGGATGGGGASVCADVLSETYPNIPVYGVGILPAKNEPEIYRMNAARTVQSFSRETDNLLLFDNDHLGVAVPKVMPGMSEDTSKKEVFGDVNQDIARSLHTLFSADEKQASGRLTGTTITTDKVIEVLNAGGLSTMCYAAETLPRPARPGVTGRMWELIEYFRISYAQKKYKQQQEQHSDANDGDTDREDGTAGSEPESNSDVGETVDSPFTTGENVSMGTGPDSTVATESDGTLFTDDSEVETDGLPAGPAIPDLEEDPATTDIQDDDGPPSFERDWPHPAKLVPLTLDSASAMMDVNPAHTSRNLFLLIGAEQHLSQQAAIRTAEWAEEHTAAGVSFAKNYPEKSKKVAVLTLCSGIGVPDRIRELQQEGSRIAEDALESQRGTPDPKKFDVFKNEETIPPAF